jgi:hypothetical protein
MLKLFFARIFLSIFLIFLFLAGGGTVSAKPFPHNSRVSFFMNDLSVVGLDGSPLYGDFWDMWIETSASTSETGTRSRNAQNVGDFASIDAISGSMEAFGSSFVGDPGAQNPLNLESELRLDGINFGDEAAGFSRIRALNVLFVPPSLEEGTTQVRFSTEYSLSMDLDPSESIFTTGQLTAELWLFDPWGDGGRDLLGLSRTLNSEADNASIFLNQRFDEWVEVKAGGIYPIVLTINSELSAVQVSGSPIPQEPGPGEEIDNPVPEPSTFFLFFIGIGLFWGAKRFMTETSVFKS